MNVEVFGYDVHASAWSVDVFPALDSPSTLVIVFGDRLFAGAGARAPFEELEAAYPESIIVGCSTSGEIFGHEVRDESLSVSVVRFEATSLMLATAKVGPDIDSRAVGASLAEQLSTDGLASAFVISNGAFVNGTALTRGMRDVLGADVVITGGLAGDGPHFERTWVLIGDEVHLDRTVAVGLVGDKLNVTHGSQGGWDRFGIERTVTRAEGNVLFELDGRPALSLYKEYLGDKAAELPASALLFPLEIQDKEDPGKRLVRTILTVDEENDSMTFAGDIPEGAHAQLMKANVERLITGAEDAGEQATHDVEYSGDVAAIAVSCVGRRLVMRERCEDEIDAVLAMLPERTKLVGFYSYGELSPLQQGAPTELHNQTMTLTVWSERP